MFLGRIAGYILRTIYTRFVFAACTELELVITKPWGNEARNGHGDELAAPMSHLGSMFSYTHNFRARMACMVQREQVRTTITSWLALNVVNYIFSSPRLKCDSSFFGCGVSCMGRLAISILTFRSMFY